MGHIDGCGFADSAVKPSREFVSFRTHSVLSTTTTTLAEREEFHTDTLRSFSYSGSVDYRAKVWVFI